MRTIIYGNKICMHIIVSLLLFQAVNADNGNHCAGQSSSLKSIVGTQSMDMEIIRARFIDELMEEEPEADHINLLINTIREDGSWPCINYIDYSHTNYDLQRHLNNLIELGKAYVNTGSDFYESSELKKVIYSSLEFWLENDFINDNWHPNEIVNPRRWAHFLLIFGSELTNRQVDEVLRLARRAHLGAWGARPGGDLIKIAAIMAKVALFERDEAGLKIAIEEMHGQIEFTSGRGLKPDFSFHHRSDRVTSALSYGTSFASFFVIWGPRLAGTKFSIPEEKLELLTDYFLDGIIPMMVHGHYRDPGAMNRSMAGPSALSPRGPELPVSLLNASSYREQELKNIIRIRKGEKYPDLKSSRFLPHSEYFSHQRPHYFTSVRMHSSRTNNMEAPYNGISLKHHHFADGSNFISRTGQEYKDIFPVWDWQKIPGTTVVQKSSLPGPGQIVKQGLNDFVGGVTDGTYGTAVMDFHSAHDPLKARKSWFFFDREFVCLGSGINSSSEHPVATTLNQSLLEGNVTVRDRRSQSIAERGVRELDDVLWIYHDKTAYMFPGGASVCLENRQKSGFWQSISGQARLKNMDEVYKDIFTLWLDHGYSPNNADYEYIVIPGIEIDDIDSYREKQQIKILSNTSEIQAVQHTGLNISQIAFHEPGRIEIAEGSSISLGSPGLVMVYAPDGIPGKIIVSDPDRRLKTFHLRVSSKFEGNTGNWKAVWNRRDGFSDIYVKLPADAYAGQSVIIDKNDKSRYTANQLFDPSAYFTSVDSKPAHEEFEDDRHYIGQEYGGGIIFYVDESGQHGLIAAKSDQSEGVSWRNGPARVHTGLGDHYARLTNARSDGIGAGDMNTQLIVSQQTEDNFFGNFAAKVCVEYESEGFGDWYLPSKNELNLMYHQKEAIGGFANDFYWSSTEYNIGFAWNQYFYGYGGQYTTPKGISRVRCIRKF